MKKILSATVLAVAVGTSTLGVVPAFADTPIPARAICIQDEVTGSWAAIIVDSTDDEAELVGQRWVEFPYGVSGGCSSVDFTLPLACPVNPEPKDNPILVGKVSRLQAKVNAQRALIHRLRAKLNKSH